MGYAIARALLDTRSPRSSSFFAWCHASRGALGSFCRSYIHGSDCGQKMFGGRQSCRANACACSNTTQMARYQYRSSSPSFAPTPKANWHLMCDCTPLACCHPCFKSLVLKMPLNTHRTVGIEPCGNACQQVFFNLLPIRLSRCNATLLHAQATIMSVVAANRLKMQHCS